MAMNREELKTHDPSHNVLQIHRKPLDDIFDPKVIAVIGATEREGAVGRDIFANLTDGSYKGKAYPINNKSASILGHKTYPNIKSAPEKVDLAIIVTPAATVPGLVQECADAGIKGLVIISAGFKEIGPEGKALEDQITAIIKKHGMRVIGPNCLGVMTPPLGMNASFASRMALPGSVAFLSQSGAMGTAILDWSLSEGVGFSSFVSIGSMMDVGWGDLIDYYGSDPRTDSIVIYMEAIGDARSFLSAAREVALTKPIIVIKAGRTDAAAKAAASHTGALTGSDDVLDAAFKRCGVLRVDSIEDLFHLSDVLAKQPRPRGNKLTIITNAGGPGVLTTDALIMNGGALAEVAPSAQEQLNALLPSAWSHANPVDILGDARADRFAKSLEVLAKDPGSDGVLVLLTLQSVTEPTKTAEALRGYAKIDGKPVIASWMGGANVEEGRQILKEAGIPVFEYPDTAAKVFCLMHKYSDNLARLYETPSLPKEFDEGAPDRALAQRIINDVRKSGRTLMTEFEAKELMAAYGIPVVVTKIAKTADEAVAQANAMGFPVVCKLFSETITHKTDGGGVVLNLQHSDAVAQAFNTIKKNVTEKAGAQHFQGVTVQQMIKLEGYEIILGSSPDPQFGPVLLFGQGGQLVEVMKDKSLGLPPLNTTLARRMLEETKIYKALKGVRGRKPVDIAQLEQIMVRFSQLAAENPVIKEIDINPLLAGSEKIVALDARVLLWEADIPADKLPKPAIRPYPVQYVTPAKLKNGTDVVVRPIRPEDEPLMVKFHKELSESSVYQRYYADMKMENRATHNLLVRACFTDFTREVSLVIERKGVDKEILAVGRLIKQSPGSEALLTMVTADKAQKQGLGSLLLDRLLACGRMEGITKVTAAYFGDNAGIQRLAQKAGFKVLTPAKGKELERVEITL